VIPPYLGLALYAEGETDHRFLDVLIRRSVEELLSRRGLSVTIGEMQRLTVPRGVSRRDERIVGGARGIQGAFHLLFIHADGGGDREGAIADRVEPGRQAVEDELGTSSRRALGVVPVRETEAWALADGEAIRAVLSTSKSDAELGLPARRAEVETLDDPKATLEHAVRLARGGRSRRRRRPAATFLDRLAETISPVCLRELPAYSTFEDDLSRALGDLGYQR